MNNIKVGSPAYRSIVARVNHLEAKQAQGPLPWNEHRELIRERAKLHEAEMHHNAAQQGAHA